MKNTFRSLLFAAGAAGFGMVALAQPAAGEAAKPGFVKVEWSEKEGEKWTIEGLADRESGRPMAKDTLFSICSNTKPLTSVLVLTFVEEGVLNLDDPVSKYFPEFAEIKLKGRPPKRPVTLRHLITHQAGFAAFEVKNPDVRTDMTPFRDQVRLAVEKGLSSEPGEAYHYCNVGFQVMGAVLEKVTGRKASDLMRERIFDPLGMTDATFYPDDKAMARAAVPYHYPPKGGTPLRYDFSNRYTVPLGNPARTPILSSCVMCTAVDYLKFSQMMARKGLGLNGRRILSEKTFDEYLLTRQTPLGDKVDASFDIHFNADRTGGSKGGLFATGANWNWAERSCVVTFRAKSPYAPEGVKSELDVSGFGGAKTTFAISDVLVADGTASCLVANNDDRHGAANVRLTVNGKVVGTRRVGLAIGESKRVSFACAVRPGDKAVFTTVAVAARVPLPRGQLPDPAALKINAGREIRFRNPLPRMRCGEKACGTYNNWELAYPGFLNTASPDFGNVLWHLRKVVWADRRLVFVDGRVLTCQLNWIRDHVHQSKGFCHWEYDMTSFLDCILDTQRADGQFFELVKQLDDFHWSMVNPDCRILYPEDNQSLVRLELEADIEYLMVEGCLQAWRATGDDAWLKRALPRLEKGIDYQTSDAKRWDAEHGLCKRPYTIDTWDFTNDPNSSNNRTVDLDEPMAIMHGDNTGVYQAMMQLAWINGRFGNVAKAGSWRARAATLRENMMKHLWNGRFFRHQLPLNCPPQDGNEGRRLSMSDAYALNRGVLTPEECRSVIDEYRTRRKTTRAFAEWFTIDPPYEAGFKGYAPGEYVNGAICPFTAGELAKGAFENGCEAYGWDILERLSKMILRDDGRIFFLYHPTTGVPQGRGPSAWGAAAILSAIDQGLAGIVDTDKLYRTMRFAPRWAVTEYVEGRYLTGYEVSKKKVDVRWIFTERGFRYNLRSPAEEVVAHLLVPSGKVPAKLLVDGKETPFVLSDVYGSKYVDATVAPKNGEVDFEVLY